MLSSPSAEVAVGVWLQPPLHAIPPRTHVRVNGDLKETGGYKRTDTVGYYACKPPPTETGRRKAAKVNRGNFVPIISLNMQSHCDLQDLNNQT